MTGTYANNPAARDRAQRERAARIASKQADITARLEALKGGQR